MPQDTQSDSYKQGHSDCTTATHQKRTADSDAAFLLPHIKKTDRILDVGCGPGTITTGFAKYATEGAVIGLDISATVIQKAKELAGEANVPEEGPGSVRFEQGNVLERLPYDDGTFDIVYSSQVLAHMPPPDLPHRALVEMRRVLKPGGILASRDGVTSLFFPKRLQLDRLWTGNLCKVLRQDAPEGTEDTWDSLPALYRRAGFDANGGKVQVGAGTKVISGLEARRWIAWRAAGQLKPEDPFYQNWLKAGVPEEEIQELLHAMNEWAETEDAWFAALQCEMLGWK
ncbi:S-adenosyl-L-methionine-dependent methyltransferase [Xylaria arbuscula]|nr:S-adenosyl-L-methionine-dependent methyltransferase [Xylaria arbuscula]